MFWEVMVDLPTCNRCLWRRAGKTRTINHFLINDSWYLVDLPGYGYAKSSLKDRDAWNAFTKAFFRQRETLVSVMLLIDASIPPPVRLPPQRLLQCGSCQSSQTLLLV